MRIVEGTEIRAQFFCVLILSSEYSFVTVASVVIELILKPFSIGHTFPVLNRKAELRI